MSKSKSSTSKIANYVALVTGIVLGYIEQRIRSDKFTALPSTPEYPNEGMNVPMSNKIYQATRNTEVAENLVGAVVNVNGTDYRILYVGDIGPKGQDANFLLRKTSVAEDVPEFDALLDKLDAGQDISSDLANLTTKSANDPF